MKQKDFVRKSLNRALPAPFLAAVAIFMAAGIVPNVSKAQMGLPTHSESFPEYSAFNLNHLTLLAPTTIDNPAEARVTPPEDQSIGSDYTADYTVNLSYSRIRAEVELPQLEVRVGQKFDLEVSIRPSSELAYYIYRSGILRFEATVRFNASVLAVVEAEHRGRILDDMHYARATGEIADSEIDQLQTMTIARIPVQAALGDAEETSIELMDLTIVHKDGQRELLPVQADLGLVKIEDAYNGRRRVDVPFYASVKISPNPVIVESTISIQNLDGKSGDLQIYTLRGQLVRSYTLAADSHTESFDVRIARSDLTAGPYFCRLTIGDRTIVRTMIVE